MEEFSEIFQNAGFNINIRLEEDKTYSTGRLLNIFVKPDSQILDITKTNIYKFSEDYDLIDLSEEEVNSLAYNNKSITLVNSATETELQFHSDNEQYFTVQELVDKIMEFEKIDRPKTDWFGGIDAHHIFYEGLHKKDEHIYSVMWGS